MVLHMLDCCCTFSSYRKLLLKQLVQRTKPWLAAHCK
jgi:hypothetical protein